MTSSPLPEAPHFRGKTLTPESPVPVHVPEPQNIPVLKNQTDETFNLMSTHMAKTPASQSSQIALLDAHQHYDTMNIPQHAEALGSESKDVGDGSQEDADDRYARYFALARAEALEQQQETNALQTYLPSRLPASASQGAHESLSTDEQSALPPLSSNQNQDPTAAIQVATNFSENPQGTSVIQGPETVAARLPGKPDIHNQSSDANVNGEGVNYQALLDNLSPSTSTAPAAENITSITTAAPSGTPNVLSPSSAQTPIGTFPVPTGLPPRPPPQEKPAIHPNYTPGEDIRSYHNPPAQNSNAPPSYNPQPNNSQLPQQGYIHNNGVAPNGLPPPPPATFQQPLSKPNQPQRSPQLPQYRPRDNHGRNGRRQAPAAYQGEDEHPRRPDVERLFEEFLHDEAIYVAEGTWDRFPQGSRLFVGNLFTEKVTKRDIFYVFCKYGRLAQISMKSAYGFVQFHDAESCFQALQGEQGVEIRGRKIHLEISKPQKNTRNAVATAAGNSLRAGYNKKSRSPDYGLGGSGRGMTQRPSIDRGVGPNNFDRRTRDDYRPIRSPSPQGFRGRGDFRGRERTPDRSRSPILQNTDDEATLPVPRRNPRDVPDVQIILVDEVDRTFVGYIQQSFRGRGLRCDVLQMPRVSLEAVLKRQIMEGVQAVVQILRKSQVTGKIPLRVYNRSAGIDNVHFDDYADLDASVAAEVVVRAKSTHIAPPPAPMPTQYPPNPAYGQPQYPQQPPHMPPQPNQQPQPGGAPSNLSNLITSLDGQALQKLLGVMSQTPQTPTTPQQFPHPHAPPPQRGPSQDLASLLHSVAGQQQQPAQQGYQYGQQPQNTYTASAPNPGFPSNQGVPPLYPQPAGQQSVQDMLAQLAKYRQ
ncbi:hypothetical protein OEA41_004509 [Lepraria neglecta]|uniref:RRM domain-containing protein n=1 Tax=Lepraria neglecta TaxID=209136 RepID=A0AAD9Z070_9LECA|nr:hypothetical protein OEA41_004509 [Lepraria neglecta]